MLAILRQLQPFWPVIAYGGLVASAAGILIGTNGSKTEVMLQPGAPSPIIIKEYVPIREPIVISSTQYVPPAPSPEQQQIQPEPAPVINPPPFPTAVGIPILLPAPVPPPVPAPTLPPPCPHEGKGGGKQLGLCKPHGHLRAR